MRKAASAGRFLRGTGSSPHSAASPSPRPGPRSDGFESDVLRAFQHDEVADRLQLFGALFDRRKVVARELSDLAREQRRAVREQDLGLADAAGVEQQMSRRRVTRVVLEAEAEIEVAQRDPGGLTAPPRLNEAGPERQHGDELRARCRSPLPLLASSDPQLGDPDPQAGHAAMATLSDRGGPSGLLGPFRRGRSGPPAEYPALGCP